MGVSTEPSRTPAQRVRDRVAAVPSVVAFIAIRVLMRIAPSPAGHPPARPRRAHPRSRAVVAWFGRMYQRSPLRARLRARGNRCVYVPTCTEYAERAVERYGLIRGLQLTGDRFRRCADGGTGSYVDFP